MAILGVDTATATNPLAEHLISELVGVFGQRADAFACTHFIRRGTPHVAVSIEVPAGIDLSALPEGAGAALGDVRHGPSELAEYAAQAAAEHAARRSGRAVRYPGVPELTGTLSAGTILTRSAIDRIEVLGGAGAPDPGVVVDTRDHVRPEWRGGALVLQAMPRPGRAARAVRGARSDALLRRPRLSAPERAAYFSARTITVSSAARTSGALLSGLRTTP